MKLSQKIIYAVHSAAAKGPSEVLEVKTSNLQTSIFAQTSLTLGAFANIVSTHSANPELGLLKELKFKPEASVGVRKLLGDKECTVFYFGNTDWSKLLSPVKAKPNWSTILSAFSTVEEAIEAYPLLKPHFEEVFGKAL